MAEKTEKATPKKLRDARKKGQVAKAQDIPSAVTFIVSIASVLGFAGFFSDRIGGFTLQVLNQIATAGKTDIDTGAVVATFWLNALQVILQTSLPVMGMVCLIGVLTSFLVVGPVFSFESMKFDLKKLNPIEGIKQKFKLKVLFELIKSCFKIGGAALIIYFIIKNALPQIISTVVMPPALSLQIVRDFLIKVIIQVGLFFLVVALLDLIFQKKQFAKEMKMEKFEVKQEFKDTEGDPMIKSRRRETFREIAYQEGPRAASKARVIVTNPTHIAVALKYMPPEDPAPLILTMGAGVMADRIIKIGLENKIPIMRNVDLARELYTRGSISEYIPEDTYEAIAEVLKWIKALEDNPDINKELM